MLLACPIVYKGMGQTLPKCEFTQFTLIMQFRCHAVCSKNLKYNIVGIGDSLHSRMSHVGVLRCGLQKTTSICNV